MSDGERVRPSRSATIQNLKSRRVNQVSTKFVYLESWAFGARVLAFTASLWCRRGPMALHPEEFITLTDHGSMKLRAAVLRAMTWAARS
jgi:hypothetical protein